MVWNDCEGILAVKYFMLEEDFDTSVISEIMNRNMPFKGFEGYIRMLAKKGENDAFINTVAKTILIELGDNKLSFHYNDYRENYINMREEKERELDLQRQPNTKKKLKCSKRHLMPKSQLLRNVSYFPTLFSKPLLIKWLVNYLLLEGQG